MKVVNIYYYLSCSFFMLNTYFLSFYRIMGLYLTLCQFHNSVEIEVRVWCKSVTCTRLCSIISLKQWHFQNILFKVKHLVKAGYSLPHLTEWIGFPYFLAFILFKLSYNCFKWVLSCQKSKKHYCLKDNCNAFFDFMFCAFSES